MRTGKVDDDVAGHMRAVRPCRLGEADLQQAEIAQEMEAVGSLEPDVDIELLAGRSIHIESRVEAEIQVQRPIQRARDGRARIQRYRQTFEATELEAAGDGLVLLEIDRDLEIRDRR